MDGYPERVVRQLLGGRAPLQPDGSAPFSRRDFDQGALQEKVDAIRAGVADVQAKHPAAKIILEIKDGYRNMKEIMDQHPRVLEIADEAVRRLVGLLATR